MPDIPIYTYEQADAWTPLDFPNHPFIIDKYVSKCSSVALMLLFSVLFGLFVVDCM